MPLLDTLQDDFAGPSIDLSKWDIVGTYGSYPQIVAHALRCGSQGEVVTGIISDGSFDRAAGATGATVSWHWERNPTGLGTTFPVSNLDISPTGGGISAVRVRVESNGLILFNTRDDTDAVYRAGSSNTIGGSQVVGTHDNAKSWYQLRFDPVADQWTLWRANDSATIPTSGWEQLGVAIDAHPTQTDTGLKLANLAWGEFAADGLTDTGAINTDLVDTEPPVLVATPSSLVFNVVQNGPNPANQNVEISSSNSTPATVDSVSDNITNLTAVNSGNTITASVSTAGLLATSSPYTGQITVVDGSVSINIPVTINVAPPSTEIDLLQVNQVLGTLGVMVASLDDTETPTVLRVDALTPLSTLPPGISIFQFEITSDDPDWDGIAEVLEVQVEVTPEPGGAGDGHNTSVRTRMGRKQSSAARRSRQRSPKVPALEMDDSQPTDTTPR